MRTYEQIKPDLEAARAKRDDLADQLEEIHTRAGERALNPGEEQRFENVSKGLARAKADVERLDDEYRDAITDYAKKNPQNLEPAIAERDTREDRGDPRVSKVRSDALRANEQASFLPDAAQAHMERTLRADDDPEARLSHYVTALADRHYFRAFATWMRDPVSGGHEWSPEEREAVQRVRQIERSMTIGTTTAGGFLVPYELDPSIIIAGTGGVSPLRQIARVETTLFNEKRFVTSLGVTSSWLPEESQATDDSPALLQPTITCKKGMAFVPVSFELFEDSSIAEEIGRLFADAKDVHEALSFTLTQSNGPVGIVSSIVAAAGANIIATASNVLAIADLYTNQAALPPRWRPNASWMMSLPILNGYRQLAQATGLNYSIVNDDGPQPKALGWPIYENSNMDSTLTGSTADYLVLSGDFKQFAIVDRVGTSIEVVQNLVGTNHRPTGQRGFLMHYRSGSDVLIQDAFRLSNFST